ncbi:FAD-dependent oxidoreductase [Microbacterium sp.]|uniref:protoporphyrinogen/coproporphyrinogen oxidase n=1 Tax=Microbacterium sp. TaxID=51671 RepID=UPI0025FF8251|nr:FAD-dependent oxidoreductase [Microbacterium sp.]
MSSADLDADLVIVGAGIAGLAIAHDAARAGQRVMVLEAADRVGGLVRRAEVCGIPFDIGAESFATRTSGVADLIADAGLPLTLVAPAPGGAHLVTTGETGSFPAPLPRRTVLGIPADPLAADVVRILGPDGSARAAAERMLPPLRAADEPSLAALITERCGPVLLARLVDPLCRSIYSQPADAVRLSRLHPVLWREAVERGSLLAGAVACATDDRAGAAVGGIVGGMWRLAAELASAAAARGARIRTGAPALAVNPHGDRIAVDTADGPVRAARVVVATGTSAARALLDQTGRRGSDSETDADAAGALAVRVVAALVAGAAFDDDPVGSGVIVAPGVPSAAKALTHANAKWPWLADTLPAGRHLFRLSARDARAPGLETPADLAHEIALLTGIPLDAADVLAVTSAVYADAVAGAPVDDRRRRELAGSGIHLAGAAVAGTGLASVVPHARALAASFSSTSHSRSIA